MGFPCCHNYITMLQYSPMKKAGRPRSRPGRRGRLADLLRRARTALGLTQEKAAGSLGVARVTLARWETGSHRPRGPAAKFVEVWAAHALGEEVHLGT